MEDDVAEETDDSNLLDTYKELVVQGFHILRKLATNDENCRVMLNAPFLLDKIMAPVTSDLLHHVDHDAWSSIVEGSLKAMAQLTAATGQTGTKLRTEISSSKEGISTMERILKCGECNRSYKMLQKHVILILTHLYEDTSLSLKPGSRQKFIEMLVNIMTDDNKDNVKDNNKDNAANKPNEEESQMDKEEIAKREKEDREKKARQVAAAEALVTISSKTEAGATIIMKANENVVGNLTAMVVEKGKHRSIAAEILEYLCIHYTDDDEILKMLQKSMVVAVPKLLGEILCWASQGRHCGKKLDEVRIKETEADEENQRGDSQDNNQTNNLPSPQQQEYKMKEYEIQDGKQFTAVSCRSVVGPSARGQNSGIRVRTRAVPLFSSSLVRTPMAAMSSDSDDGGGASGACGAGVAGGAGARGAGVARDDAAGGDFPDGRIRISTGSAAEANLWSAAQPSPEQRAATAFARAVVATPCKSSHWWASSFGGGVE
ncbi:hypothetical protein ACQ4PT_054338 [Festuca glaucescens]